MEAHYKEVDFKQYCGICEHKKTKGTDEPCNECLENPTNLGSVKPVNYEPDDAHKNKK